jgi:hypothetical protein
MAQQPGKVSQAQLDAWLNQPEIPDFAVLPHSDALTKVDEARAAWLGGKSTLAELPAAQWNVHEWQQFLDGMPASATLEQIKALDARYKLSQTPNAIIASAWFHVAIAHGDQAVLPAVRRYLGSVGRMRLVKPLYRELCKTPAGKAFAEQTYAKAKAGYNPLTQQSVERVLKGEGGG